MSASFCLDLDHVSVHHSIPRQLEACIAGDRLPFQSVDTLTLFLQHSVENRGAFELLSVDTTTIQKLRSLIGRRLLPRNNLDSLNAQQIAAVKCLRLLSPEDVHLVLRACPASLQQQLWHLPNALHLAAYQAAYPSLLSHGTLEINGFHGSTRNLIDVLNYSSSLRCTKHLILKNVSLRPDDECSRVRAMFVDALHAAVEVHTLATLTLQDCTMRREDIHKLLRAARDSPNLMNLDISPMQYFEARSTNCCALGEMFADDEAMHVLGCMTQLKSLTLRSPSFYNYACHSDLSERSPASKVGMLLSTTMKKLTSLTHLIIDHPLQAADLSVMKTHLKTLRSLNISSWHRRMHADGVFDPPFDTRDIAGKEHSKNSSISSTVLAEGLVGRAAMMELDVALPHIQDLASQRMMVRSVMSMRSLQSLALSQIHAAGSVLNVTTALKHARFESLTRLRLHGMFSEPQCEVKVRDACCGLFHMMVSLPALLDLGIEYHEPFQGPADKHRRFVLPLGIKKLESLQLNATLDCTNATSCALAPEILSLCIPQDLHTLKVSLGTSDLAQGQDKRVQDTCSQLAVLLQHNNVAVKLQCLSIVIRDSPLDSTLVDNLRTCFSGTRNLTQLSLDVCSEDACVQQLFPSLLHLTKLQDFSLAISGEPDAYVVSLRRSAALSLGLGSMHDLRQLRLEGLSFCAGCLEQHLAPMLAEMVNLTLLHLNCGESEVGSSVSALETWLCGHQNLRKLVTGPWYIDEPSAGKLSAALQSIPGIQEVDLSKSHITDSGARHITQLLKHCPMIRNVCVSERGLSEEGARCLLEALKGSPMRCPDLWYLADRVSLFKHSQDLAALQRTQHQKAEGLKRLQHRIAIQDQPTSPRIPAFDCLFEVPPSQCCVGEQVASDPDDDLLQTPPALGTTPDAASPENIQFTRQSPPLGRISPAVPMMYAQQTQPSPTAAAPPSSERRPRPPRNGAHPCDQKPKSPLADTVTFARHQWSTTVPAGQPSARPPPPAMPHPPMLPPGVAHPAIPPPTMPPPATPPPMMPHPPMLPPGVAHPAIPPPVMAHPPMLPPAVPHPAMPPPAMPHPLMLPPGLAHPALLPPTVPHRALSPAHAAAVQPTGGAGKAGIARCRIPARAPNACKPPAPGPSAPRSQTQLREPPHLVTSPKGTEIQKNVHKDWSLRVAAQHMQATKRYHEQKMAQQQGQRDYGTAGPSHQYHQQAARGSR